MRDFSDFLEREAYGGQFQSKGQFTIGTEKALEKLAKMALADPSSWVLKMVQAATIQGCLSLDFRIARRVVQVDFECRSVDLSPLEEALLSPSQDVELFYRELLIGLRTLLVHSEFRLRNSSGDWLAWDGVRLRRGQDQLKESDPCGLSVLVSLKKSNRERAVESSQMHKLLCDKAVYAPLRLSLDGREIRPETKFAVSEPDFTFGNPIWTAPLLYAHFPQGELEERLEQIQKAKGRVLQDPLRSPEFFLSLGRGEGFTAKSCHLNLQYRFQTQMVKDEWVPRQPVDDTFFLEFTRYGVICLERRIPSKIKGCLHLPLDEGRSDLSGLSLQVPDTDRKVFKEPERLIWTLVEHIHTHTPTLHHYPTDSKRSKVGFVMAGGATLFLSMAFGGAPLLAMTLGGVAGAAGSASLNTFAVDSEKELGVMKGELRKLVAAWRRQKLR